MRVLCATTAGAGHFAGLLPFARACAEAGHEVRVAAPQSFAGAVAGAGLAHEPLADADPADLGAVFGRVPALVRHEANALVLQEVFGRVDRDASLPGMRAALDRWKPHVVLREPAELASYIACEERGVPHVQTNIGLSRMDDRLMPLLEEPLEEVGSSASGLLTAPRWTLLPPSFDEASTLATGRTWSFRDPAAAPGGEAQLPTWWTVGADDPLVYVTFGSVAAAMGLFPAFYVRVLEQLAQVPARVLLTLGEAGDAGALGTLPPNVHVERWWPQRDVMPHASAVVGHGGFGTTLAALARGAPQVVVPLFSFDQFLNAERVEAAGLGLALVDEDAAHRPMADTMIQGPDATTGIADAVARLLDDAQMARTATGVAADIAALPAVEECVALLPTLS